MSNFRSKLARYNTICCEQVMPVPVIPLCAISCCLPRPICEYKASEFVPPEPPQPCNPSQIAIENAPLSTEISSSPIKIPNYCPELPDPPSGSILTLSTDSIPSGYLLANGEAVSRITYQALFLAIGTYYGDGDGSTTFNLPNLSCEPSNCFVYYIIKT